MFFLTYLRRELRRRMRQAVVIAAGLAVGIGLVVTVTAASAGVTKAQAAVLHALYGIGTDVTVTTAAPPAKNMQGHTKFVFSPGAKPKHEHYLAATAGLGVLNASSVAKVARLRGVAAAAGGLTLNDTSMTIPAVSQLGPGGKPPASALPTSFTVNGVDLAHAKLGPFGSGQISSGRSFAAADAGSNVAVVDSGYAKAHKLRVGSAINIAGKQFRVIGITVQPQGGGSASVYIPLGRAQALAVLLGSNRNNLKGKVTTIYVAAAAASAIPAVSKEISALLPKATVTSSASLASAVTGSLASAAGLASDLGRWLAVAVLAAAFAMASLLTMAAVARRVCEFGTLKALGWRSRRIVAQIMGESAVTGLIGAAAGAALGFGGAALVGAVAPKLSATVAVNPGSAPPQATMINGTGTHHHALGGTTHTVAVHLTAPVTVTAIVLAVVLAIAGGLIAGSLGGWRAARLRPAEALGRVA